MRTIGLVIFLFLFPVITSFSQEIYVVTGNNVLYRLNLDNCSIDFVVQVQQQCYDISFDPNGNLYGISSNGNLFLIDTLTGQTTLVHNFNGQSFNSLTIGADGTIYTIGDGGQLWSYTPSTGVAVLIGTIGFAATGDLTFYHGQLYVAVTNDRIVKINLLHPNQSQVVIDDNVPGNILGIVSDVVNCNEINCYAITNGNSDVYLIDFENHDLKLICQLNIGVGGGASTSEFLNSSPLQIDTLIGLDANCKNENGILNVHASGGTGTLEYSLNGGPFVQDTLFTNLMAGAYTMIIRDEKNCMDTSMITLTAAFAPVVDTIIAIPSQCDLKNGSLSILASGGSGQLEYSIDSITFQPNGNFENLPPDRYKILVKDSAGCYVVDQALIDSLGGASIITADIVNTTCGINNGKITIMTDSLSGTMYSINGVDFQNENEFNALGASSFHLAIQDEHGCKDTLTVNIAPSSAPELNVINTTPEKCGKNDGSIRVNGTGGIPPYQFALDNNTFQNIDSFSQLGAGKHTIYVVDQAACLDSVATDVAEIAGLNIVDLIATPTACGESTGSIELNISEGTPPFEFSINNQSTQFEPSFEQLGVGHYVIHVTDAFGCAADTNVIIVRTGCPVYIPNVFSPNGDGINDLFQLETVDGQNVVIKRFLIFDRWGNNVYQATNLDIHSSDGWWDGTFKKFTMNPGVFAYYIEAEFEDGEIETYKGDITLVR